MAGPGRGSPKRRRHKNDFYKGIREDYDTVNIRCLQPCDNNDTCILSAHDTCDGDDTAHACVWSVRGGLEVGDIWVLL